jgi:long-chain acyl-CoA synthetase
VEKEAAVELSDTIPTLLSQQVAIYGSETILRKKARGIWNAVTWLELDRHVRGFGQGLRGAGLDKGETVAVLSETRPELAYADLAILGCGAASVAVHPDEGTPRVREILRHTRAAFAVVEGEEQLDKVLSVRNSCPELRRIVILDMKGLRDFRDPACMDLASLIACGAAQPDWKTSVASISQDDIAAHIVPRTGPIRPISHADIMRQIEEVGGMLGIRAGDERLAVLPMAEPAERVLGLYLALKHRIVSNYLENPETATENLREVKPTVFGADTEAWERLHARIMALTANATLVQKMLYKWAIGSGTGLMRSVANLTVLRAVRGELGFGRLRVAYVGDGAVSDEIREWAQALGITVRYINPFREGETHV